MLQKCWKRYRQLKQRKKYVARRNQIDILLYVKLAVDAIPSQHRGMAYTIGCLPEAGPQYGFARMAFHEIF